MSPNFLKFVKGVLEKLQSHEADKKNPEPLVKEDPTLPNKNLIFKQDSKTEAEKEEEFTKKVLNISKNPYGEKSSNPPKGKL